jgi:hypothetical protein
LTFTVGSTAELAFEGMVRGDQIAGTFTDAAGARKEWSAERTKRGARRELRE